MVKYLEIDVDRLVQDRESRSREVVEGESPVTVATSCGSMSKANHASRVENINIGAICAVDSNGVIAVKKGGWIEGKQDELIRSSCR